MTCRFDGNELEWIALPPPPGGHTVQARVVDHQFYQNGPKDSAEHSWVLFELEPEVEWPELGECRRLVFWYSSHQLWVRFSNGQVWDLNLGPAGMVYSLGAARRVESED